MSIPCAGGASCGIRVLGSQDTPVWHLQQIKDQGSHAEPKGTFRKACTALPASLKDRRRLACRAQNTSLFPSTLLCYKGVEISMAFACALVKHAGGAGAKTGNKRKLAAWALLFSVDKIWCSLVKMTDMGRPVYPFAREFWKLRHPYSCGVLAT
jgi:hypothetical protein